MGERENIFEKKDRRMGWMNALTNANNMIQTLIEAGVFKPKNKEEAYAELNKYHRELFNNYIGIELTPKAEVKPTEDVCAECGKPVNEKVKRYSLDHFDKIVCFKCQTGIDSE
jgi:formylmethanofuran dehydrogenase subunit E